ncbi:MAG: DUF3313 domain-containing protein [Planctomycetota bacterium]
MCEQVRLARTKEVSMVYNGLAMAVVLLLMAGCASKPPKFSGFLGDYSALQPDPKEPSILYWEKPNVEWRRYTKLWIDVPEVYPNPDAKERDLDPAEMKKLAEYFRQAAVDAVADKYPVTGEAGPDVLRIRAAITDIIPTRSKVNILVSAAAMFPVAVDLGGASMECEFLDSTTNTRLAAVVDSRKASWWSMKDAFRGWSDYGHTKGALLRWAKMLRESLDEVHPLPKK